VNLGQAAGPRVVVGNFGGLGNRMIRFMLAQRISHRG
jgi:hypothetical protein